MLQHPLNKIPYVLQSLRDIVIIGDNDLVVIALNKRAKLFFGFTEEEVRGKNISFLLPGHPAEPPEVPMVMQAKHRNAKDFVVVVQATRDPQATIVAWTILPISLPRVFDFNFHATFQNTLKPKLGIDDIDLHHRKVLIRVDYNVPLDRTTGAITDDTRIRATLPTIRKVLRDQGKLVLMSHLGRPKGKVEKGLSLAPVAARLEHLIGKPVKFIADASNAQVEINKLKDGEVALLENLRFHEGEESKDPKRRQVFAEKLASYADLFVSDAFGTAHRDCASMTGIPRLLGAGAMGYLMEKELRMLSKVLFNPPAPYVAIVGGAKVSDKIALFGNLFRIATTIIIGGAMAYTFLEAQGYTVGASFAERVVKEKGKEVDLHLVAKNLLAQARQRKVRVILPVDHVIAKTFTKDAEPIVTKTPDIPEGHVGMDIGPRTQEMCRQEIAHARTLVWNGPMGVSEFPSFAHGTRNIARAIEANRELISVVGGGHSAAAVADFRESITHISTGGGATLSLLEGKALPGLVCLTTVASPKL